MTKGDTLTIRMSKDLRERVDAAILVFPYKITVTSLVERGLELAIAELAILTPDAAGKAITEILRAEARLKEEAA